jgi:hypothetical protein
VIPEGNAGEAHGFGIPGDSGQLVNRNEVDRLP